MDDYGGEMTPTYADLVYYGLELLEEGEEPDPINEDVEYPLIKQDVINAFLDLTINNISSQES
jgi:hypothetical protein